MKFSFKDIKQEKALAAAVRFFAVMIIVTLVSRAVSASVMPAVETGRAYEAQITQKIRTDAFLTASGGENISLPQQILIDKVFFSAGESVKEGDCIAVLSVKELIKTKKALEADILRGQKQLKALKPAQVDTYALNQAQTALNEAYAAHAKAIESNDEQAIASAQAAAQNAEAARNAALHSVEQAQKSADEQAELNSASAKVLSVELESKIEEVSELTALITAEGRVLSPISGTITLLSLIQGSVTSGTAAIVSGNNSFTLKGSDNSELKEKISSGMSVALTQNGISSEAVIASVETGTQGEAIFTAAVADDKLKPGSVQAEIIISRQKHQMCVSLQSLRTDINGKFVYTLEKRSTVLGESNVLVRTPVNVIEFDSSIAAVEGAISSTQTIVKQADKPLYEGARVKIK